MYVGDGYGGGACGGMIGGAWPGGVVGGAWPGGGMFGWDVVVYDVGYCCGAGVGVWWWSADYLVCVRRWCGDGACECLGGGGCVMGW